MREAFAHDAVLTMAPGADTRAPGAAITVALCGHWDHQPPCPLAPHHTRAERVGGELRVRTLFACEPEHEAAVRRRIDSALAEGRLSGPDGQVARWELHSSGRADVLATEMDRARRLVES